MVRVSTSLPLLLAVVSMVGCGSGNFSKTNGTGTTGGKGTTSGATTSGSTSGSCPDAGQSCVPANACDLGAVACDGHGGVSCADQAQPNPSANGTPCNDGGVCDDGTCTACSQDGACAPQNVCDLGTVDCSTGMPVCDDTGSPNVSANGQSCGVDGTCAAGSCVFCAQGSACAPSNVCDQGSLDCSDGGMGYCADTGAANAGQNGASCGVGKICQSGQCNSPSGATNWPIVPNQGGGIIATPNLIFLTYSDDLNQSFFEQYGIWIADGGYLPSAAGQYGLHNGTFQFVNLGSSSNAPVGTTTNFQAFPDYMQSLLNADTLPPYVSNNFYVIILPSSWPDTSTFCQSEGGYHTYFQDSSGDEVPYAVVPNCEGTMSGYLQEIQFAISHEIVEGTTDPLAETWEIQDPNNPWTYLGGEVGDLCASNTNAYVSGQFNAQLIWSNQAVMAGDVPCQPWPSNLTYLSLVAPSTMATAAPGGQAQITVTGWTSAPYSAFYLAAVDGDYVIDFSTNPQLSSQTITGGTSVTVTLSVPQSASIGQHGAAWVIAQDYNTGENVGSAMVGVTVQ